MEARDPISETSEPSDTDEDESDTSDSPWEVSSDSEAEYVSKGKLPRQTPDRPVSELAKSTIVDPINFIIDCLWKLPIRSPAPIDRMRNKHSDNTTAYLSFDIMYVRDKFPSLNETVTTRLAKMISRRRQLIQYRKDHTDALQEKKRMVMDTSKTGHGYLARPTGEYVASESASSSKGSSQRTELTKATTLKINAPKLSISPAIGLYTPSVSDFASSTASEQTANAITIRLPNRPRTWEGRLSDNFICPYCSTAQVITSERRWKKHVLSDLQPYICTYSDCQLHEYFFDNLDDWFHHESRTHRVEWFCNIESHQSFVDKKDFLVHMHTAHSEPLNETQLLSLHHIFQRPSNMHSGTCTLCGQHANRLKSHLARHLEQLALFAIPQTDYMAALEENDVSSNAARQGVPALSSIGSTRVVSDHSSQDSGSGVSVSRSSVFNQTKHRSRTATDDQYIQQDEQALVVSSDEIQEEVDTSWDQITSKFKDARIEMYGKQVAKTFVPGRSPRSDEVVMESTEQPLHIRVQKDFEVHRTSVAPPPKAPRSLRERASRITSNLFSPSRSQKEPETQRLSSRSRSLVRDSEENPRRFSKMARERLRNSAFEQTSSQPWPRSPSGDDNDPITGSTSAHRSTQGRRREYPPVSRSNNYMPLDYPDPAQLGPPKPDHPREGLNAKEKRTLRQRLSKATGIGYKAPEIYPTEVYLYDPQDYAPYSGPGATPARFGHELQGEDTTSSKEPTRPEEDEDSYNA